MMQRVYEQDIFLLNEHFHVFNITFISDILKIKHFSITFSLPLKWNYWP